MGSITLINVGVLEKRLRKTWGFAPPGFLEIIDHFHAGEMTIAVDFIGSLRRCDVLFLRCGKHSVRLQSQDTRGRQGPLEEFSPIHHMSLAW